MDWANASGRPIEPGYKEFADLIAESASDAQTILEMGTGRGQIALLLASRGFNVDGVDINAKSIADAKVRAKNWPGVGLKVKFYQSNLFSKVASKYDVIVWDPPMTGGWRIAAFRSILRNKLSRSFQWLIDVLLVVGRPFVYKWGTEKRIRLIELFLRESKNHLTAQGRVMLLVQRKEIHILARFDESYQTLSHPNLSASGEWVVMLLRPR